MTKQEFRAVRRYYRLVCRRWFDEYLSRCRREFVLTDRTIIVGNHAQLKLKEFADLVGCKKLTTAAAMLNSEKWGVSHE